MEFLEKKYIFICAPYLDGIDNINYVDISILSNIREEYFCFCKQWDESYIYKISRIATFFRKYLIFLKKSSILNIAGGTPEFACATLAGKKMVFDQKPPLLREQAVGSSQIKNVKLPLS